MVCVTLVLSPPGSSVNSTVLMGLTELKCHCHSLDAKRSSPSVRIIRLRMSPSAPVGEQEAG